MSPDIRRLTWVAVLLPLPALLAAALLFGWQIEHLSSLDRWVDHTDQVIGRIERIQKLLLDQETSLRGYLLSRQPDFLAPWNSASRELPEMFASTRQLVADNAEQVRRLDELESQHLQWQVAASEAIKALQAGELALAMPAPSFVDTLRQRKVLMDRMRSAVDLSLAEEQQLLTHRRTVAVARTRLVRAGGGLLLLAVGLLISGFVRRQVRRIAQIYNEALAQERRSREAAEALVAEVRQQSLEVEEIIRQNVEARTLAESRLAEALQGQTRSLPDEK